MSDQPKCYYCGKFVSVDPEKQGKEWDGKLIWTGGAIPEPSHDEFWHIDCDKEHFPSHYPHTPPNEEEK